MDIKDILQSAVQDFIRQHESDDENKLLLKHKSIHGVPASLVADQIAGRRKAKLKLPSWYATKNLLYPPSINIEQSSSEKTAAYKTDFLKHLLKIQFKKVVDLTGGFGVDSFFFSSIFNEVNYVEPDENLFELVKHNHAALGRLNIQHHNTTAEAFFSATKDKFDLVYIDPSRRSKGNQKIFRLADCTPDITQLQEIIFNKADLLLVKASPMLDILQGIKELKHVAKIYIVAVDNECKEVLFLCRKGHETDPDIEAVDLKTSSDELNPFRFSLSQEKNSVADFSPPLRYLYEPNAALLKAGAFKLIAQRFALKKIQRHTHLYTSDKLIEDFPGKVFKIEVLVKADAKNVRQHFPDGKGNVVTRNYPLSPEQLKKKTGLKDGGEKFLIGFSGDTKKFTAVCARIK